MTSRAFGAIGRNLPARSGVRRSAGSMSHGRCRTGRMKRIGICPANSTKASARDGGDATSPGMTAGAAASAKTLGRWRHVLRRPARSSGQRWGPMAPWFGPGAAGDDPEADLAASPWEGEQGLGSGSSVARVPASVRLAHRCRRRERQPHHSDSGHRWRRTDEAHWTSPSALEPDGLSAHGGFLTRRRFRGHGLVGSWPCTDHRLPVSICKIKFWRQIRRYAFVAARKASRAASIAR